MAILTVKQLEAVVMPGRYNDGNGLYLEVDKAGGKRWLYRYQLNGKRTTHGLGGYHPKTNSLAIARSKAVECKAMVNKGIHPGEAASEQRDAQRARDQKKREIVMTFQRCADEWYERNEAGWTNVKHRQQVKNTLKDYAFPHIGLLPIAEISISDIRKCLDPIWTTKTETANKAQVATGIMERPFPKRQLI